MRKPCIHLIAGARPNFMKIAPIVRALRADGRLDWRIVHTGQHYDRDMNDVFFDELGIPPPDVRLGCGGGSHATQTGRIMEAYEALCATDRPDAVLVVGDVNSTLACSIVAKKACIPVAHVEAGLRSGDMSMPEEIRKPGRRNTIYGIYRRGGFGHPEGNILAICQAVLSVGNVLQKKCVFG